MSLHYSTVLRTVTNPTVSTVRVYYLQRDLVIESSRSAWWSEPAIVSSYFTPGLVQPLTSRQDAAVYKVQVRGLIMFYIYDFCVGRRSLLSLAAHGPRTCLLEYQPRPAVLCRPENWLCHPS